MEGLVGQEEECRTALKCKGNPFPLLSGRHLPGRGCVKSPMRPGPPVAAYLGRTQEEVGSRSGGLRLVPTSHGAWPSVAFTFVTCGAPRVKA